LKKKADPLEGPHSRINNKFEYLGEFKFMFEMALGWLSVGWGDMFLFKKPEAKFLVTLSL
jgi:hypothetical protein